MNGHRRLAIYINHTKQEVETPGPLFRQFVFYLNQEAGAALVDFTVLQNALEKRKIVKDKELSEIFSRRNSRLYRVNEKWAALLPFNFNLKT